MLVGVAQARVIEFGAKYPGDWMVHGHPHHMMNQMVSMVGPMARGHGSGMEEGMGVVRQGHALAEDLGPKFGRGMGMAESERAVTPLVGPRPGGTTGGHGRGDGARRVPGFPQDMSMPMDEAVGKPETYGMARGWSGATQGMMTVIRVLPPARYDDVMRLVRERRADAPVKSAAPPASGGQGSAHGHWASRPATLREEMNEQDDSQGGRGRGLGAERLAPLLTVTRSEFSGRRPGYGSVRRLRGSGSPSRSPRRAAAR